LHSAPSIPGKHAEEQRDQLETAVDLKRGLEQPASVERDEEQALKVYGHLDLHGEQNQA